MSSNPYHNTPIITRSNYEEFFLLYVDDELTPAEKDAVDQFLLLNPDLHQELEILLQTRLLPELISMEEKEPLFSGAMKMKASDESLLLYVDNELNEEERKRVEADLANDTAYRLQYELLLKTRSDASETVVCPFKKDLYRRQERRIPVMWWRVAAVVLLAVGLSTFMLTYQEPQPDEVAILPAGDQPKPPANDPATGQATPTQPGGEVAVQKSSLPAGGSSKDFPVIAMQKKVDIKVERKSTQTINTKVQPTPAENVVVVAIPKQSGNVPVLMPQEVETPIKEPLTKEPVTSDALYALNHTDASVNTVPADVDEADDHKASLKGLLRKATRFVERRANINVTNEDEELLIGAVAISLK